jgi:hypothetical protein
MYSGIVTSDIMMLKCQHIVHTSAFIFFKAIRNCESTGVQENIFVLLLHEMASPPVLNKTGKENDVESASYKLHVM